MTHGWSVELKERIDNHSGEPDRVYMNVEVLNSFISKGPLDGAANLGAEMKLFGLDVRVGDPPYGESLYVLDSDRYPKARDFKNGRVSTEKI